MTSIGTAIGTTFSTQGDAPNTPLSKVFNINTITTTGFFDFRTGSWQRTGVPDELYVGLGFTYHLVG